ncbi:tyrosine-type recombinase/integrase [Akkermansia biwaensis]
MPRKASLTPKYDAGREKKGWRPWFLSIPKKNSPTGKRHRLFFSTKESARVEAKMIENQIRQNGMDSFRLSSADAQHMISAKKMLEGYGLSFHEAVLFLKKILERGVNLDEAYALFSRGCEVEEERKGSKKLYEAVDYHISLKERQGRRGRTIGQLRSILNKIMKQNLDLAGKYLTDISIGDCRSMIENFSSSERQRGDAKKMLRAVFNTAMKNEWVTKNPVLAVIIGAIQETEIIPLTLLEVRQLFAACRKANESEVEKKSLMLDTSDCLIPLAIMLFAGIRPEEVTRLGWTDVNEEEMIISVRGQSSKTGGVRHVRILPPLKSFLEVLKDVEESEGRIVPKNWANKWGCIHKRAGWGKNKPWPSDVLRHTFASYHKKHFNDMASLKDAMGHTSEKLLRDRYMNLKGVSEKTAKEFWSLTAQDLIVAG